MAEAKKTLVLFFTCILFLSVLLPMPITYAEAQITGFAIQNVSSNLIAGKEYVMMVETDKADSTVAIAWIEYSTNGGATWNGLSRLKTLKDTFGISFVLPIDRMLTYATIRTRIDFFPYFGANSHSEKSIGPYKILQPGSPSDVAATANKDNSVTLTWYDNSNMESSYSIIRSGPDGSKTFSVKDTKDNIGPLNYVDKTTNSIDSIIYAYSIYTVIDPYDLPDSVKPGPVSVLVKTKQLMSKITEPIKDNTDIFKINQPAKTISDPPKSLLSDKYADKLSQYILDVDKVAVRNLELNNKSLALNKGENQTLTAVISPSNAAEQKITWSSDNPKVAVVDSAGKVTIISVGTAIIKAQTEKGFTRLCVVSVPEDMQVNEQTPTPIPVPTPVPNKTTSVSTPAMPKTDLTDIAGHWANEDIKQAVDLGFVNGYPDGTFRPNGNVNRAEFANMLMNGIKATEGGSELTFVDKDKIGVWAIQAVSKAVKLGIISGYSDGTFRPSANITHAEMISMVVRASGLPMDNTQPTGYADDSDIPKWVKPAVKTAELNGIIIGSGTAGKAFAPQALSTRAEAVSAIVKMLKIGK